MKFDDLKKLIRQKEDIAEQKETECKASKDNYRNSSVPLLGSIGAGAAYLVAVYGPAMYGVTKLYEATVNSGTLAYGVGFPVGLVTTFAAAAVLYNKTVKNVMDSAFEVINDVYMERISMKEDDLDKALFLEKEVKTIAKAIENNTLSEHLTNSEAIRYKNDKENYIVLRKTVSTVEELALMNERDVYDKFRDRNNLIIGSMGVHRNENGDQVEALTVIQSDYIANCNDAFIVDKRNAHSMVVLRNLPSETNERLQLVEQDVDLSNLSTREGKQAIMKQIRLTNQFENNENTFRFMLQSCAKQNNMVCEVEKPVWENDRQVTGKLKPVQKDKTVDLTNSLSDVR